jgi:hypothetical protein
VGGRCGSLRAAVGLGEGAFAQLKFWRRHRQAVLGPDSAGETDGIVASVDDAR